MGNVVTVDGRGGGVGGISRSERARWWVRMGKVGFDCHHLAHQISSMLPSDAVSPGKVVHLKSHLARPCLPPCPSMSPTLPVHVSHLARVEGIPGSEGPSTGPSGVNKVPK